MNVSGMVVVTGRFLRSHEIRRYYLPVIDAGGVLGRSDPIKPIGNKFGRMKAIGPGDE
jgi:hypothetical protein